MTKEELAKIKYVDLHFLRRSGASAHVRVLETCITEIEACWKELGRELPEDPKKQSTDEEVAELRARLDALEGKGAQCETA